MKREQKTPAYIALNPSAQVPTLEIDGYVLTQSLAIIEYLEESRRFQGAKLLPKCESERVKVRMIAEIINSGIQPVQNFSVGLRIAELIKEASKNTLSKEELLQYRTQWNKEVIERGFNALEPVLQKTAGTYCVGNDITIADVCLVPQVYNARRYKCDMKQWPNIARIDAECMKHPAFTAAHPDKQPDAVKPQSKL